MNILNILLGIIIGFFLACYIFSVAFRYWTNYSLKKIFKFGYKIIETIWNITEKKIKKIEAQEETEHQKK